MIYLSIILGTGIAVLATLLLREHQRIKELESDIVHNRAGNLYADHFLTDMLREMRSEKGLSGAMHTVAEYLADQCNAESAIIYKATDGRLTPLGMSGSFPLIHNTNRSVLTHRNHLFEMLRRERIRIGHGFLGIAAELEVAELIPEAAIDSRFAEYPKSNIQGSLMVTPLRLSGKILGLACVFGNRNGLGGSFEDKQFELFQLLAPQMTMALDLVFAYGEISRKERIDQELEFARQIQFSLLPDTFPAWDQFSITAFTRSAKEVNGDFYDFVEIDEDRLLIVIGDACGKGVPACMLTAMTRSVIRAVVDSFVTLEEFLHEVNHKLYRGTDADRFITLGCCLLDKKNSLLEFGRAGHTELFTFVHNHIRAIMPDGAALAIMPDDLADFDTFCMAFVPGMSLMLYSDGITEAVSPAGEEFGVERLQNLFKAGCTNSEPARGIINMILEEVGAYEEEQSDDQTLILIQHN